MVGAAAVVVVVEARAEDCVAMKSRGSSSRVETNLGVLEEEDQELVAGIQEGPIDGVRIAPTVVVVVWTRIIRSSRSRSTG